MQPIEEIKLQTPRQDSESRKKFDVSALPPINCSIDGSQKGLMNSIGTPTKIRKNSAERSSFERKSLPKPFENPNLTLDKFVSQPAIYVD
jgi:hypothetical protein